MRAQFRPTVSMFILVQSCCCCCCWEGKVLAKCTVIQIANYRQHQIHQRETVGSFTHRRKVQIDQHRAPHRPKHFVFSCHGKKKKKIKRKSQARKQSACKTTEWDFALQELGAETANKQASQGRGRFLCLAWQENNSKKENGKSDDKSEKEKINTVSRAGIRTRKEQLAKQLSRRKSIDQMSHKMATFKYYFSSFCNSRI